MSWLLIFGLTMIGMSIAAIILTHVKKVDTNVSVFLEMLGLVVGIVSIFMDLRGLASDIDIPDSVSSSVSSYVLPEPSPNPFSELQIGNTITCGYYNNEDIRWKVVDTNGNKAFLLAEQAIACRPYNIVFTDTTWESSDLRAWLNYDFINAAFDSDTISYIADTTVVTYRSNDTVDKIFVLSFDEIERYCPSASSRTVKAVAVARSKSKCDQYWLRTPGRYMDYTMCVKSDGSILKKGYVVTNPQVNVRPAMWVYTD